ncbi:MAG: cysteine desulfurase [Clostridia bacterium]|nr:cysteine desulfurase [Clostridia bacterium]
MHIIYLDNSATTRPSPVAAEAAERTIRANFGNPSSLYRLGLDAEKEVKAARKSVASCFGASDSEVFFTSGGTESDDTALFGVWESRKKQGSRIISTAVEHPAVLRCLDVLKARGADVVLVPVKRDGNLDMEAFKEALSDSTVLVSVMHVNNETGAIFPVEEISSVIRKRFGNDPAARPLLHSDCVQSLGKIPVDVRKTGVDLASFSAHKIHGIKGSGALYIKSGLHVPPFIYGGGQEKNFRSGTENVPGIAAFGAAAEELTVPDPAPARRLKELILSEIPDVKINSPEDGCPLILNVSFIGCRAEVLLHMLEQDGICVSTGSACSSRSKGSHVLSAMGLSPEEIEGALRFSFCRDNTLEEVEFVAERLVKYTSDQRRLRSAFRKR